MERKRSGRRPGSPETREQILSAAREAFATHGFERSSIRRIASDAGVDPALVHHYFGNKQQLFLAAVEAPIDPQIVAEKVLNVGERVDVGHRIVLTFVEIWDSPTGNQTVAFLKAAVADPTRAQLTREFVTTQIVRQAVEHLRPRPEDTELRGNLVASQLLGLALSRYILKLPRLATLSREELAAIYGPAILRYLTASLEELGVER